MTRTELKALLVQYVDKLNRYEQKGNKKAIRQLNATIEWIKKELNNKGIK